MDERRTLVFRATCARTFIDLSSLTKTARAVDKALLPIRESFAFAVAPIDRRDVASKAVFDRWLQARAAGAPVPVLLASVDGELGYLERTVKLAAAYLWLGRRFPDTFDDAEATTLLRSRANAAIEAELRETASHKIAARVRPLATT